MQSAIKKMSKIISVLFVPPVITVIFLFKVQYDLHMQASILVGTINFLFAFILPIAFFVLLYKRGKVMGIDVEQSERYIFYIIGIILSLIALISHYFIKSDVIFSSVWIIYIFTNIFLLLINSKWKISAHTTAASIPAAFLFFIDEKIFLYFGVILIIVAGSRLILKKHTYAQVLGGILLGILTTFTILKIDLF